jgi:hypothetical protein
MDIITMGNVTNLSDHKPHIMIMDIKGNSHVMPISLIEDIISGKRCITDLEDYQYIIPTVLKEWFNYE